MPVGADAAAPETGTVPVKPAVATMARATPAATRAGRRRVRRSVMRRWRRAWEPVVTGREAVVGDEEEGVFGRMKTGSV